VLVNNDVKDRVIYFLDSIDKPTVTDFMLLMYTEFDHL